MTKEKHVAYWLDIAEKDMGRAEMCFKNKDYVFCLFCLHMALEKTIKALWVKNNEVNYPPKIHNLVTLISNLPVGFNEEDLRWLDDMNTFQLEGRYPDYVGKIYKRCTKEFTEGIMDRTKKYLECLIKELQQK